MKNGDTKKKPSRATAPISTRRDDAAIAAKLQDAEVYCDSKSIGDSGPTLEISLASARFAGTVLLSLVVFVGVLLAFRKGVVIERNVRDALGSTEQVDHRIEIYQVANGFVTALIGMAVEANFMVFIIVATTFLRNVSWYPGDDPSTIADHHQETTTPFVVWSSNFKKFILWGVCPVIMYNRNVAITAMFVSHQTTGFRRNFLAQDLIATSSTFNESVLSMTEEVVNLTSIGNGVSVLDTILRGAVRQRIVPFEIDPNSSCTLSTMTDAPDLPTIRELRSVSVMFGFPTRDWNMDALPFGLVPTYSFSTKITIGEDPPEDREQQFDDFQQQANVTWATMYELFLQGKLLYERSVSDTDAQAHYECALSDRRDDLDEGLPEKRRCFGAASSLHDLDGMADWDMHTMYAFMDVVKRGFATTTPYIESASTNLTVEVYDITPQLKLTSMTLNMPYSSDIRYRAPSDKCDIGSVADWLFDNILSHVLDDDITETFRQWLCDEDKYVYEQPREACGQTNCIFQDQTGAVTLKKGLQLMPYTTNCSTEDLYYDEDFLNFFPSGCVPEDHAVFLYGLGTYVRGDMFDSGYESGIPYIIKPRRHLVLTFAKLEWQFDDLSTKFNAKCGINATAGNPSPCAGLVYDLENATALALKAKTDPKRDMFKRVLVLGQDQLPADRMQASYLSPVQLLTLTTRAFYYPTKKKFFEWEYVDITQFEETNWPGTIQKHGGLNDTACSGSVDSYISMFEANHLYMSDTRQPLYTAALFYLFQDAAVKTVKLTKTETNATTYFHNVDVSGTTELKGDLAKNEIRFKIPPQSLVLTFVGLGLFLLLVVLAIACPTQRLKMGEDAAENIAQQYARFRQEDEYPEDVLDCALKLPTGNRVALDEYVVDSLTLHHKNNTGKKIYM